MLPKYAGRTVILLGQVTGQQPDGSYVVRAADGMDIIVIFPPGEQAES